MARLDAEDLPSRTHGSPIPQQAFAPGGRSWTGQPGAATHMELDTSLTREALADGPEKLIHL